jgi:uncharacterized protein (TIGR03792 family)
MIDYKNKKNPVEYLVFKVEDENNIEKFIELDHEIWTKYLASYDGFISKEVLVNDENPGEIHTILIWREMDAWKSIPLAELKETTKKFDDAFGEKYEITRRIHSEYNHGLYKVRHYEID